MCWFMGKSRVQAVCRGEGGTAAIKSYPNPVKNDVLKSLWGRLCEKRDEGIRERDEGRFH